MSTPVTGGDVFQGFTFTEESIYDDVSIMPQHEFKSERDRRRQAMRNSHL